MADISGMKERHTSTVKVTSEILEAISHATEYYGNVSALAKMMGVAHSTIIFWRSGKTSSMSGRLWVTRIRPVLEPFLPSSKVKLNETPGQYTPQFPVIPPYMNVKKVERHQVNVISVSALKSYDPALESVSAFVRAHCTEKRSFYHECRRAAFSLKIDSLLTDIFPENSYILAYPDGLQNGCIVVCKLQGSTDILARKYSKNGSMVSLSILPGGSGDDIVWDCEKEIGRLAWCFPLVELNLDLLPCMELSHDEDENDDMDNACDQTPDYGPDYYYTGESQRSCKAPPKRRGRKRKNVTAKTQ